MNVERGRKDNGHVDRLCGPKTQVYQSSALVQAQGVNEPTGRDERTFVFGILSGEVRFVPPCKSEQSQGCPNLCSFSRGPKAQLQLP